jgi:Subtilase family
MLPHLMMHKKTICPYLISFYLLFCQLWCAAQKNTDSLFKRVADLTPQSYSETRPYYICIWENGIPEQVKTLRQYNEKTAVIEIKSKSIYDLLKQQIEMAPANNRWKCSPFAEPVIERKKNEQLTFILSGSSLESLFAVLEKIKGPFSILSINEPSHSVVVKTTAQFIHDHLLPLKEVIFADLRAEPHIETGIIGYNRGFHGLNAVDYSIPNANGKNIVAGVKEQKMEETDIDLYKRVVPSSIAGTGSSDHATVISSIIGGAGNSFYNGRGIAYGCTFFPSNFSNLFADNAAILNAAGVTVQNHSYGTNIQQFYGAEAVSYDAHAWANKNFVHVFSAGNQGSSPAAEGPYVNIPGYANLTGNFKMAKNIITVGAIDNKGNIPALSSSGPLYDGRVAPQLTALGPNGTSDAAAVVSGTIAVIQQVYADSNSQARPPASLTKAILYNTADDIHRTGIDYKTGYGLLNSFSAIKAIQQKEYDGGSLAQGQQWVKTIAIPPNTAQFKITLAWTDSAAALNNSRALLNDLDLEVRQIGSGTVFKPWVLNASAHSDSLAKLPVRKRDSLNTAEQVTISLPTTGNYQLMVTGTSVIASPLPFHVAYHSDTLNTFSFTNPQHASDVNRVENENLDIRWRTFVADTNQTGNLYISYNSGLNWQLLKAAHKIYTNLYRWPVKDTSSTAILKMETVFGDFRSKEFIISPVNRPVVDFLCTDSFGLSWKKHIYATAYKIYTLVDSAYLKPVRTVTDTFIVLNRLLHPSLVYAVEPVLGNGLPAARSVAQNITFQGTSCFYKTLYYNLLDQNLLNLVLELSAPGLVDSIFFEQVTASGQWLQTAGNTKVSASTGIYEQLVNNVPSGTSYWRVKIKLKNGVILFTEIISLLTTGKHFILFYPNPAGRNTLLTYTLQQGVPSDSRLQLLDINGRLLYNFSEMPGSIDASKLPPGLIIYKLFTSDNRLLETGKLILL